MFVFDKHNVFIVSFLKCPAQATKCQLAGIRPNSGMNWPNECSSYFTRNADQKRAMVRVASTTAGQVGNIGSNEFSFTVVL